MTIRLYDLTIKFAEFRPFHTFEVGDYFCRGYGDGNVRIYQKSGDRAARRMLPRPDEANPTLDRVPYPTYFELDATCWQVIPQNLFGKKQRTTGKVI